MDEKQFQELVEKVGKEAAEKIKAQVAEATKGLITPEQLEAKLKEIAPDAKSIKIGEGDKAKSLDEMLREIGQKQTELAEKMKKGDKAPKEENALQKLLDSKMDEIKSVMDLKEGSVVLNIKAAAVMDTTNTVDDTDIPDDILHSFSSEAYVPKRQPRQYVYDIADRTIVANTTQTKEWLEEGDEAGSFAEVSEGAVKPLMSADLVRNVSRAKKAAGKYVWTEEFEKFRPKAMQIIRTIINDKVQRDFDAIVTTSLVTSAASYLGVALAGQIVDPTDYDAIGAVAAQIEALDFVPNTLILNPQDKWRLALSKDNQGQYYLNMPMVDPNGITRMMGFAVYTSNRLTAGEFILGESGLFKIEQEAFRVRMGYGINVTKDGANVTAVEHDLDHNRMRIIVETFFHTWIATNHTGSFVKASFDTVKETIDAGA